LILPDRVRVRHMAPSASAQRLLRGFDDVERKSRLKSRIGARSLEGKVVLRRISGGDDSGGVALSCAGVTALTAS
jgi:hypothetical protein